MKDKYGYFGTDTEGYIHYMESFNSNFPENKNSDILDDAACDTDSDDTDIDVDDDFSDDDC